MGFVENEVKKLVEQMTNLGVTSQPQQVIDLGIIEEGSEEEEEEETDDEDEGDEELFDSKEVQPFEGIRRSPRCLLPPGFQSLFIREVKR